MCVHRTCFVNKLVPSTLEGSQGFQQQEGEAGMEKEKANSAAIARHTEAEGRTDSGYWAKNVLFYYTLTELVQSSPYTLMQHPNNFVLGRDRAEQLFSNSSVLALFTEILM